MLVISLLESVIIKWNLEYMYTAFAIYMPREYFNLG